MCEGAQATFLSGRTESWHIDTGSVLDTNYLSRSDSTFERPVYSWGSRLHHTAAAIYGRALGNGSLHRRARMETLVLLAIYNDQGWISPVTG